MLQHAAGPKSQWDIANRARDQICIQREKWLVMHVSANARQIKEQGHSFLLPCL